jgi:mono/diheme cytochrome c family protein
VLNLIEVGKPSFPTIDIVRRLSVVMFLVLSACSVGRPADDASGEEIYQQLCANCHGDNLNGGIGPPLGPGSNTANQADAFLEFTIMNGRGRMVSFSSSLNDEQLDRLVVYLREEQAG